MIVLIVALASKSLHCLNPHNSRGRGTLLSLLSLTHGKSGCQHLEQISQSSVTVCVLSMCCPPELDHENTGNEIGSFSFHSYYFSS